MSEMEDKELEYGKRLALLCKKGGYKIETAEMLIIMSGSVDDTVGALREFITYVERKMTSSELINAALKYVTGKD